jgi:hypothetical protein
MRGITGALIILAGAVLVSGSLIAQAVRPTFEFTAFIRLVEAPQDIAKVGIVTAVVGLILLVVDLATGRSARTETSEKRV